MKEKRNTPEEVIEAEVVEEEPTQETVETEQESAAVFEESNESENEELQEWKDRCLRLQADFENFRNRTQREKADTIRFANESLLVKFVDVLDDFERAFAAETEENALSEGIHMVYDRLRQILESQGLEAMETENASFDPEKHHAVVSEESDSVEPGHIIETYQKGYLLHGKTLRPAMVKVSK